MVNRIGWDSAAINLRGCSGEPNRLLSSYHSGKTDDIETVINYVTGNFSYSTIFIAGFSLGGNIVLKYAGEKGGEVPKLIRGIAGISVPCDLQSSAIHLKKPSSRIYLDWLIRPMKRKLHIKKKKIS